MKTVVVGVGSAVGRGPQVSENPVSLVTVPVAQAWSPGHGHRVGDLVRSRVSTVLSSCDTDACPVGGTHQNEAPRPSPPRYTTSLAKLVQAGRRGCDAECPPGTYHFLGPVGFLTHFTSLNTPPAPAL